MGVPELKQKIQMQIQSADERLLRIVSSVFDNYLDEEPTESAKQNTITFLEKKAIDDALLQVAKNQTVSHDCVMEETKKRYSKYFKDEN